jgi:hypothetical protein
MDKGYESGCLFSACLMICMLAILFGVMMLLEYLFAKNAGLVAAGLAVVGSAAYVIFCFVMAGRR